jgi:UDP-N-acetylglucosamine 2-epimerase
MPEEINRVFTDRIANTNYCCTEKNYSTMVAEGYGTAIKNRLKLTGDLMYDAFLKVPFDTNKIIAEKNYVAATIHRAANIVSKDNLTAIVEGLNKIHKEIPVFMPLHPHTKKRIIEHGLHPEFSIVDPLGYPAMKTFLTNCSYVITDSGGAAREAFFCKKRSLIVMEYPFWPEIIEAGCSTNVSANSLHLYESFFKLPSLCPDFESPIFGTGNAAQLIREDILVFRD